MRIDTYLPKREPALSSSQDQDILDQGYRSDLLSERNQCLVIPAYPRVHVNMCFVLLGGEHMGVTDSETVWRGGALLESGFEAQGRVQLVGVDADVLGDLGPGREGWSAYGREERFGKHDVME